MVFWIHATRVANSASEQSFWTSCQVADRNDVVFGKLILVCELEREDETRMQTENNLSARAGDGENE